VLPGERRGVGKQRVGDWLALVAQVSDRVRDVGRVPVGDRGDHQVQAGRAELLRLRAAIGDGALLEVQIIWARARRCSLLFRPAW